eukprot:TRINITY_DN5546_c0_g1_i1.p1 TRINITY_DN5546_c0_g1~~TRINITY_DN5546_c0_g1_i1.p1  ORF type:complete len:423 (+),score=50.52 TRINITY_DN5546_c0_g1_i1:160-1428(+)
MVAVCCTVVLTALVVISGTNAHHVQMWMDDSQTLHIGPEKEAVFVSNDLILQQIREIQQETESFQFWTPPDRIACTLPLRQARRLQHNNSEDGYPIWPTLVDDMLLVNGFGDKPLQHTMMGYRRNIHDGSWSKPSILPIPNKTRFTIVSNGALAKADVIIAAVGVLDENDLGRVHLFTASLVEPFGFRHVQTIEQGRRLPFVALDKSACWLAVGAFSHAAKGYVTVLQRMQNATEFVQSQILTSISNDVTNRFGIAVTFAGAAGETLFVGAPSPADSASSVSVYSRDSVAYKDLLVVGAEKAGDQGNGQVYVYGRRGGFYTSLQVLEGRYSAELRTPASAFGSSVAVYGDSIAVGSKESDGGVYLYELHADTGVTTRKQVLADNNVLDFRADSWSVALGKQALIVGGAAHAPDQEDAVFALP